jgi:hypothetical protein
VALGRVRVRDWKAHQWVAQDWLAASQQAVKLVG